MKTKGKEKEKKKTKRKEAKRKRLRPEPNPRPPALRAKALPQGNVEHTLKVWNLIIKTFKPY